jgi:hypothetical protein
MDLLFQNFYLFYYMKYLLSIYATAFDAHAHAILTILLEICSYQIMLYGYICTIMVQLYFHLLLCYIYLFL